MRCFQAQSNAKYRWIPVFVVNSTASIKAINNFFKCSNYNTISCLTFDSSTTLWAIDAKTFILCRTTAAISPATRAPKRQLDYRRLHLRIPETGEAIPFVADVETLFAIKHPFGKRSSATCRETFNSLFSKLHCDSLLRSAFDRKWAAATVCR